MHYVYILRLRNNKTYVGCTGDLRKRVTRHERGYVPATAHLLPVKLDFM